MKTLTLMQSLALVLAVAMVIELPLQAQTNYCWKDSYTRGVGTIPSDCSFGTEKQGLLCYPKCPAGYTGLTAVCWQNCPAGFTDNGAFCSKPAPYGRGAGYPWQIQDGFSNAGMLGRCQSSEGRPCEMWGALAYPTCKDGFYAFGANVCTPVCQAGMTDIGVSCAKQTTTRATIVSTCGTGQVYDTGLCYTQCKGGYTGVGPVCWGACPANLPFECGGACALDQTTCAQTTNDEVLSVVKAVSNIALAVTTLGAGTAAELGVNAGTKLGFNAACRAIATNVEEQGIQDTLAAAAKTAGKQLADKTLKTWKSAIKNYTKEAIKSGVQGTDVPDFDWNDLDPSGIATVVAAYNHPVCAPPPPGTPAPTMSGTIPVPPGQTRPTWSLQPGLASDIAVTSAGTVWAISPLNNGADAAIWSMLSGDTTWTQMPGAAVRVTAGGRTVVVVTAAGNIYQWTGAAWQLLPGLASDAGADAVGNIFVIGKGGSVWEMKAGQTVWTALPAITSYFATGVPVRISATGVESVSVVTDQGVGYIWTGPNAALVPWVNGSFGGADIARKPDGSTVYAYNTQVQNSANGLLFEPDIPNNIVAVATGGRDAVWAVSSTGKIFKYQ